MAVPSILQQSFVSVGNIILQSIINTFGASVIAGYSAAVKLNNMVITSFTTLGNGISNYTSQNMGAGKMDRVKEGFGAGRNLVWLLCVPLVVLYFFFGRFLLLLFMNDPQGPAIDTGMLFLRILSPFYFVVSVKLVADGILRGCGLMVRFMIATFTDLICAWALPPCSAPPRWAPPASGWHGLWAGASVQHFPWYSMLPPSARHWQSRWLLPRPRDRPPKSAPRPNLPPTPRWRPCNLFATCEFVHVTDKQNEQFEIVLQNYALIFV